MKLYQQILLAMIIGVITGLVFPAGIAIFKPISAIFVQLLKSIIVPLVFASLAVGVVSLGNIKNLGVLGGKTIGYFVITTIISASIGLGLATLFKPGAIYLSSIIEASNTTLPTNTTTIQSLISSIFPSNMVWALAEGNMLAIIFLSLFIGFGLTALGKEGKPIVQLLESINHLMMKLTKWIIAISPVAIWALMAKLMVETGLATLLILSKYVAVVLLGLAIHGFIVLPLLLGVIKRKSPLNLFKNVFSGIATAFSTASSAASLPVILKDIQEKEGVSKKTASFVLPLGITINMDGTALYQAVAAIFLAQYYGVTLSIQAYGLIIFATVLASIGAAAIPSAGLVTLSMILGLIGVPLEGVAIIIGIDRIIDMCRTSINIWGNSIAAKLLDTPTIIEAAPKVVKRKIIKKIQNSTKSKEVSPTSS